MRLATLSLAIGHPLRHETIVLLLDGARRGRTIVAVSGTHDPDAVIEVVECVTQGIECEHLGAIVVASVRPPGAVTGHADPSALDRESDPDIDLDRDIDRWLEMSEIASLAGVEVLEWYVIGSAVRCPRDDLGEPPRW